MSHGKRIKVLIAIDFSPWARQAFDWYTEHLHNSTHDVICFHCAETAPVHGLPYASPAASPDAVRILYEEAMRNAKEQIKKLEEEYSEYMKAKKISGRIVAKFAAKPGEAIVGEAAMELAEMIVMGTRGLGSISRTILGSVSNYVLHHAHCPVVICCHAPKHT